MRHRLRLGFLDYYHRISAFFDVPGTTAANGELLTIAQEMHSSTVVARYAVERDENVQVNGFVFVCDMSGITMKHMSRWSMDDMRNWNNCWQVQQIQSLYWRCIHEISYS